ncbi:MAG: heparinase II/III family protein [Bacteroidaceae bacterium]|nr:heparinase II/III family protein [Bacteroidaceae bacterium]
MRIRLLALLAFVFVGLMTHADDAVTLRQKLPRHPRLLMIRGAEKGIMKDVHKDSLWLAIHQGIIAEADALVATKTKPVEYQLEGRRLLGVSREALRRIFFLSYAFRTEHDNKYMVRAREELNAITSFSDWHPDHFLDTGEMTLAAAIGYDWLYDQLSKAERAILEQAIIEKGLTPSLDTKKCWFITANNNWNQVCHCGLAYGAIAVWEQNPELAAHIVNRAIENLPHAMNVYAPDGAYPEGCGYWDYGTTFNVLLLDALRQVFSSDFGLSKAPGFMLTGGYIANMYTPALNWFAYSDCGTRPGGLSAPFWFYRETGDSGILFTQMRILQRKGVGAFLRDRLAPTAIIWGHQTSLATPPQPTSHSWHGEGISPVFVTRSGWGYSDSFMGMKVGTPNANHGHMDEGSFIFESHGVEWAVDLGPENYNTLEQAGLNIWDKRQGSDRWSVFRYHNLQHNTLTFDGEEQIVKGEAHFIEVKDSFPGGATADLTPVYAGKAKSVVRRCELRAEDNLYVEDRIETGDKDTRLTWTMVTQADVVQGDGRTLYLSKSGQSMRLYVGGIEPPQWDIVPAKPTRDIENPNKGYTIIRFTTPLKASTRTVIRVSLKRP